MKKTKINIFPVISESYAEDNHLTYDLKKVARNERGFFPISDSKKEDMNNMAWPVAHLIGAKDYNFKGEENIETVLGLAGYLPIAHKDFNDFYGSLKDPNSKDYMKFNSLEKMAESSEKLSNDVIICPWDSSYKPERDWNLIDKINKEEIILDSIDLAKRLNEKGLRKKVDLIVYDKGFEYNPLELELEDCLGENEEAREYVNKLKNLTKKYGIEFVEKTDLPYPYILYETLRSKNRGLFG
ncbi:MAG: hypothetical protein ACOC1P_03645 [Minisyncoccales bacterium]